MEKEHDLNEVVCQEKHAQKAARGSDAEPVRKRKTATSDQSDDEQLGSKAEENCHGLHFHNDLLRCAVKAREKDQRMGMRSRLNRIQERMRSSTDTDKRRIQQRYNRMDLEEMDCITMDTTRNAAVMTLMTI